jgi:two-component system, chemotaxis family, response regulator Rcp1
MQAKAPGVAAQILLLAEKDSDATLIRGAINHTHLNIVAACPSVLSYLRRQGIYSDSPRPDLILLDLDLSNQEECAILEEIKRDPDFRRIPVVVLASNDAYNNIFQAYDLHANAYLVKPEDEEEFVSMIQVTMTFWLTLARLPHD